MIADASPLKLASIAIGFPILGNHTNSIGIITGVGYISNSIVSGIESNQGITLKSMEAASPKICRVGRPTIHHRR